MVSGLLRVFCVLAIATPMLAGAEGIRWSSGVVDDSQSKSVGDIESAFAKAGSGVRSERLIVTFDKIPDRASRMALEASGLLLQDYLGSNSYFALVTRDKADPVLLSRAGILNARPILTDYKLDPYLFEGKVAGWALSSSYNFEKHKLSKEEGRSAVFAPVDDPNVALYVVFYPDVDLDKQAEDVIERHRGKIRSTIHSIHCLNVILPWSEVRLLAAEDSVQFIETPLPMMSGLNNENRVRTEANIVNDPPYGLDGSGVSVMIYDEATAYAQHPDFEGRLTARDNLLPVYYNHPTHVAGTVGAGGTAYPGMAPGVTMESYAFEQIPDGEDFYPGYLYSDPGDIEDDHEEAINVYNVDIANHSIGFNIAHYVYLCEWEGNYGITSALIDSIVRGELGNGEPFLFVKAAGNERGGRCGDWNTIAPPSSAKNQITVGAVNSDDDSITSYTSWGPTDDGRMKPDLVAPGDQIYGDGGVTSLQGNGGYYTAHGTSMAAPTVTGLAALLLQDYRVQFPSLPDFRNSTLKILFAHTAVDLDNPGPDNKSGYGSVRIQKAVDFMRRGYCDAANNGSFVESQVDHGESVVYSVVVTGAEDEDLKVTLAWDDPPATPNCTPVLINDLDLIVYSPSGVRAYPWTLDPDNPGNAATQDKPNKLDNIEQVFVEDAEVGVWKVIVRGCDVPEGPQEFSLCASPDMAIGSCVDRGVVFQDKDIYRAESQEIGITVIDCGLNVDSGVIDTATVNVYSQDAQLVTVDQESVTLTETAVDSAIFTGSLLLDFTDSDGVLLIEPNGSISVSYVDSSPAQTVTVTSSIGRVIQINASGTGDYATIQAAIDAASDYDFIVCTDGTYTGSGNRDIHLDGKKLWLRSLNGPSLCTINCQGTEADPHRGFLFSNQETSESVVEGFTVIGGYGPDMADYNPDHQVTYYISQGGGMYFTDCSPMIVDCVIDDNAAVHGGSVYSQAAYPVFQSCTFSDNEAEEGGGFFLADLSHCYFFDCLFDSNDADDRGGALLLEDSWATMSDCALNFNTSDAGGAIACVLGDWPPLVDPTIAIGILNAKKCIFANNTAVNGGACYLAKNSSHFTNCLFLGNSADNGGAMYHGENEDGNYVTNSTFCNNSASIAGGGVYASNCGALYYNNNVHWNNSAPTGSEISESNSSIIVTYSDIEGGWTGTGNINVNPQFMNTPQGVYRLQSTSPCIDAGDNTSVPEDVDTDLDGCLRFFDAPNTTDTGNGTAPIVDMGAYEYRETDVSMAASVAYHGTTYGDMGIQVYPAQTIFGYPYNCEPRLFTSGETHRLDIALSQAIPSDVDDITVTATDAFTFTQSATVSLNAAGDTITAVFDPLLPNNRIYTIEVSSAYITDLNFEYVIQTGNIVNFTGMNVVNTFDKSLLMGVLGSCLDNPSIDARFDIARVPISIGCLDSFDKSLLLACIGQAAARLTSAVSMANHGATEGDLGIQVWPVPTGSTIGNCEPRILTEQTLALTFDGNVEGYAAILTVEAEDTSSNVYTATVTQSGNTATAVFNPALPDEKIYTITISGCATGTFEYVVLEGNAYNTGTSLNVVDIIDENEISSHDYDTASEAGPEFDVDLSGIVNDSDADEAVDREGNYAS